MKKIIFCIMLFAFAAASFAQQTAPKQALIQTDYLKKSKKQKKTGLIFLGAGAAFIVTSFVIPEGQIDPLFGCICKEDINDEIKSTLILTGVVALLGSLPFFIASSKSKKKANYVSAFIHFEKTTFLQQTLVTTQSFPAIAVRIRI